MATTLFCIQNHTQKILEMLVYAISVQHISVACGQMKTKPVEFYISIQYTEGPPAPQCRYLIPSTSPYTNKHIVCASILRATPLPRLVLTGTRTNGSCALLTLYHQYHCLKHLSHEKQCALCVHFVGIYIYICERGMVQYA